MKRMLATVLTIALFSVNSFAQIPCGPNDSPQWRGPNRDGISGDKGLLREWPTDGPSVAWQIDYVGAGYSSVSIKDGLIITMGDLDGVEHVIALRVADGSRVWAVQPETMATALADKIALEFKNFDQNKDGQIDEVEALARIGTQFHQYDKGDLVGSVEDRAAKVMRSLDKNDDQRLTFEEAGRHFGDKFAQMESVDKSKADELAQQRASDLIKAADTDGDGKISRKESRANYLSRIFSKADQKVPGSDRGDQILTNDEVVKYFNKREAGRDGQLTKDEVVAYYKSRVTSGDGILSRDELKLVYGGYRNNQGDGPRGTPTIDSNRVYAEGGNGDVTCLDLQSGKTVWHKNLVSDFGGQRPGWGYSESPLIVDDLCIVTPGGEHGTLAALNKETGDVVWRSQDMTQGAHYSSPIATTIGGIRQVVQFARKSVFGVRLDSGKLLWEYDGANNNVANCCTPIVANDHVFVASAYGTGGGLAKISTNGDSQSAKEVYFEQKMGIHHGGIVKIGDYMYTCGGGTLMCVNFLTGDIAWQNRSVGKGSLFAADGMLYVLGERQKLALVEATPDEYREHGQISLDSYGRPSWAHPVVAGGVLYIRDQHTLTAFQVR